MLPAMHENNVFVKSSPGILTRLMVPVRFQVDGNKDFST